MRGTGRIRGEGARPGAPASPELATSSYSSCPGAELGAGEGARGSRLSAASGPGSFDVERSGDLKAADRSRLNGRRSVGNHRRAAHPATVPGLWAIGIRDIL